MATKVYGLGVSPNVMKVELALKELEVDYQFVLVDITKGQHHQPEYLAKNPFGYIPFFEDGDVKLSESLAIIRYVAAKYPDKEPGLYGSNLSERAMVDQWLEVCGQSYTPPANRLVQQTAFAAFNTKNEALLEQSLKDVGKLLDIYEQRLQSCKFLAGDFFSLADLAHIPHTYLFSSHSEEGKALINDRKHVKAWWEDVTARPAWKEVEEAWIALFASLGK